MLHEKNEWKMLRRKSCKHNIWENSKKTFKKKVPEIQSAAKSVVLETLETLRFLKKIK